MNFQIGDYLEDRQGSRGKCKACTADVQWSKIKVASHKRSHCSASTQEDKELFTLDFSGLKRFKYNDAHSSLLGESSMTDTQPVACCCSNCCLTADKIQEITSKLGKFFYRTGISFRLVESEAFKEFVKSLSPAYSEQLLCAKTLSGTILERQYEDTSKLLNETLSKSKNLTLLSDGWTNVRGEHIVNYCIKAPDQKPFFHKSIDSSGIPQNATKIANQIMSVIEEIGAENFRVSSLIMLRQ